MSCNAIQGGRRGTRKSRKMRGGMGHGMGEAINAGNFVHAPANTSDAYLPNGSVDTATNALYTGPNAAMVGGRRRKTKKGGKKSKKSKKGGRKSRKTRKMRGGAGVYNSATAGASFTGAVGGMPGAQGYGQYSGYNVGNPEGGRAAGPDGVIPSA